MNLDDLLAVKTKSVSRIEEPIGESVVPVMLITQRMIRESGARTLKDLLVSFVPGMTFVQDQNEVNVAMRGIFSSAQQKILILLEGHRLNSRLISAANPDHAIGLDKISRIEVIRGPGSAVYGNVALTAVINILLIKGEDLNGAEVAVATGDHGQKKLSANWGKMLADNRDLFLWFYGYRNSGEKHSISPENDYARAPANEPVDSILGGFLDKPAYDIGLKINDKKWSLLINQRRAHYVEPFTSASLTGEAYNYHDYSQPKGIGPGFQYTFLHLSATYTTDIAEDLKWQNSLYYDESDMESTFVFDPSIQLIGQGTMYDRSRGLTSDLTWTKKWGSAIIGIQFDEMEVYKSGFPIGAGGVISGNLFTDDNPLVRPGKENVQSIYSLYKYYVSDDWLMNIGFRYDLKDRLTLADQENISPRLGAVFSNDREFQFKLSYSESFVDSPYWNRYGALPSFRGSENLAPEKLKSFQLTPSWHSSEESLSYEINLFYNDLTDAVFRNNNAAADEPINTNSGKIKSWGHEHLLQYRADNWQLRLVGFFNQVIDYHEFSAYGDEFHNIPNETLNLIFDYQWSDEFSTSMQVNYFADRLSPININLNGAPVADPFPNAGVNYQVPNNRLPSEVITNLSFTHKAIFDSAVQLELHFYNLFDVDYQQGGTTLHPYPQEGRWLQAQLRYQFK